MELFTLTSVIDGWPHRRYRYDGVRVTWFVVERTYDPGFDYAKLIDRPVEECYGESDCVDELFTQDEAKQFGDYLRQRYETDVTIKPVGIPVDGSCCPRCRGRPGYATVRRR